jgi:hypothetical protein
MDKRTAATKILTCILAVSLLAACNMPSSGDTSAETSPGDLTQPGGSDVPPAPSSPSGSTVFMPQQMQSGSENTGISTLTYYWLDPAIQGVAVDVERSYADSTGFSLELHGETQDVTVMGGDQASLPWEAATASGTPMQVRGQPAYSFQSQGGVSVHWTENDNYYLVAGTGLGLNEVQALVDSLIATDLAGFQARLSQ